MTTKPKMGRPRRAGKVAGKRIAFRVTAEERKRFERAARLAGYSLTDWLRIVLEATAKNVIEDHQKLEAQINDLSQRTHLAQLAAHAANSAESNRKSQG